ncbi:ABC-2 type transport system ATP-binding protein [Methanococcoides vulcani]|uniref:ABC-2 type transport system ATP-binding protein n=1 Tax=Methanococcoides vulcani TaxID=1353158 RepID=A0A1H9YNA0_9EURY|nr:ABC transporter ATP-binding protein [Methanococcoides vulcani]SES70540.1 ABC-2 type transport system ATP-binding protein [Methanococcoides vulcani]
MDSILSLSNVSKSYGNFPVLKGIDLDIRKGEFVAILGSNGAGKTTLVKIMSTLSSPSEGVVEISGHNVADDPASVRSMIGVISHETHLYNDLTAEENLRFFGKMYGIRGDGLEDRINELLEQVELSGRSDDRVVTFSRGMKQRLSIARSLIHEPQLLFLDEPYTGLDQHASRTFEKVLQDLDPKDTTRVMVTHDLIRTFQMCNRVVILDHGRIVFDSPMSDVGSAEELKEIYISNVKSHSSI